MSLMSCLRALRNLQGYCERCCWVTAVLSTVKKERTFRRQECFTYSCWQVCTWGLLRSRSTGQDAGCGCRECGQCCTITLLSAYVAVVEQRAPVLRAAM